MYRSSSSSEIMKPVEKAKPFSGKNAREIIRSQDIPDFILSAGSLGYPGLSIGSPMYQPSSDPQFTIQLQKVEQIERELLRKSGKFWKLDTPGTDELQDSETSEDDFHGVCFVGDDDKTVDYYNRYNRVYAAHVFRKGYKFVQGQKYCITSDNIFSWESDKCYDKTWVAVHGMDSICMVTRRQHVDMTRVDDFYQEMCTKLDTMCDYASTVLSEVEFLPYDDEDFNVNNLFRQYGQIIEKPFGVVCVVSDTKKVHEESGHEDYGYHAVRRANNFLKEKLAGGLPFTFENTVQTAIRAFQHLCPEELKAEDIWVTTLLIAENWFEHMHLLQRKQHLAVISGDTSGVSGFTSDGGVPRTYFEQLRVLNPISPVVHHESFDDECKPSLVSKEGDNHVPRSSFDNHVPRSMFDNHVPFSIVNPDPSSFRPRPFSSGPGPSSLFSKEGDNHVPRSSFEPSKKKKKPSKKKTPSKKRSSFDDHVPFSIGNPDPSSFGPGPFSSGPGPSSSGPGPSSSGPGPSSSGFQ